MSDQMQEKAHRETQRLLDLLNIKDGALNFDFHYDENDNFSFIELGPRNGGNLIPEVIKYATGIDLVKYTVDSAIGLDCSDLEMISTDGYYSSYILHAIESGTVKEIWYSEEIRNKIIEESVFIKPGDMVSKFTGSNNTLGTMIMKFETSDEMLDMMDNMESHLKVIVE
jgi:hypothetical protein